MVMQTNMSNGDFQVKFAELVKRRQTAVWSSDCISKQESGFQVNGFGVRWLWAWLAFGQSVICYESPHKFCVLSSSFSLCCFILHYPLVFNLLFFLLFCLLASLFQKFPVTFSQNYMDEQWSVVPYEKPSLMFMFSWFSHSCYTST